MFNYINYLMEKISAEYIKSLDIIIKNEMFVCKNIEINDMSLNTIINEFSNII